MLADDASVGANLRHDARLELENEIIKLRQALFTLSLNYNLVSTGPLVDKRIESLFHRQTLNWK